jgi:hypothetical protein
MEVTNMARRKTATTAETGTAAEVRAVETEFKETGSLPAGWAFEPHNAQQPFRKLTPEETKFHDSFFKGDAPAPAEETPLADGTGDGS